MSRAGTMLGRGSLLRAAVVVAVVVSGCGDNRKAERPVFKVHGRLTFDGVPMSGAEIAFNAKDQENRDIQPKAKADQSGDYTLSSYRQNDGAPAGEYIVTIYWPAPLSKAAAAKADKAETPEEKDQIIAPDRLNGLYSSVTTSKLRATVEKKDNTIDFALTK
jgi:hypothetical protein